MSVGPQAYTWLHDRGQRVAFCMTFVRGLTPDEVLRRMGADPRPGPLRGRPEAGRLIRARWSPAGTGAGQARGQLTGGAGAFGPVGPAR
ncbi:DUF6461 domain-containing protein [Embleya sp. NBC_00896]|uniref:DUF6461 domain-containing protein n=1 Tax=Embleya sp. NBC_00896 TaxID=2975961 RepID=UPI00386896DB